MKKLFVSCIVTVAIVGCSKTPEQIQKDLFDRGLEHIERSEFDRADSAFAKLQDEFPQLAEGRYGTGLVLEAKMLYYDALGEYLAVTETSPAFVPARLAAARMFERLEKLDRAVETYSQASTLPEIPASALAQFGFVLMELRRFDEAEAAISRAEQMGLDPATIELSRARLSSMKSAGEASPPIVADQKDGTADYFAFLADYLEVKGLIDSAITVSTLSSAAPDAEFHHRQTDFLRCLRTNYLYRARRIMESVSGSDSANPQVLAMTMRYGWASGESFSANKACDLYRQLHDRRATAIFYEIKTRWMKSDLLAVQDAVEYGNLNFGELPYPRFFLDFVKGELELAAQIAEDIPGLGEEIRETSGFADGEREFHLADAFAFYRYSGADALDTIVQRLVADHGSDPVWLVGIGDVYGKNPQGFDAAQEYYQMALEKDPGFAGALDAWLTLLEHRKQYSDALRLSREYSHIVSWNPGYSLRQSLLLVRAGETDPALAQFEQNIRMCRGNLSWYQTMAVVLDRKNLSDAADSIVALAVAMNGDNPDAYLVAARWALTRRDHGEAAQHCERGLQIEPDNPSLNAILARSTYLAGDLETATELFEDNLQKWPGSAETHMLYSRSLAESRSDSRRAENLARRAVFLSGSSEAALVNLAHVYYELGRYDLSRGEGRRAAGAYAESPEVFFILGMAYYKTDHEDAGRCLERSIELGLRGEKLETARETLANL
ncbi:MAG: tetratricopeptide repeat protein [Candidatus Zixiibacteriota bacterium]|nr:MAG: tetratricopeptide repeat protein [candidate division Zixibacteria bacterium]